MKKTYGTRLENGRVRSGEFATAPGEQYGAFLITGPCGQILVIMADDGGLSNWEHVSVSLKKRPPNWEEMCFVKNLFWESNECVVQYHPPATDYVNDHPYCLHLWRPLTVQIPMPPSVLVGLGITNLERNEAPDTGGIVR